MMLRNYIAHVKRYLIIKKKSGGNKKNAQEKKASNAFIDYR